MTKSVSVVIANHRKPLARVLDFKLHRDADNAFSDALVHTSHARDTRLDLNEPIAINGLESSHCLTHSSVLNGVSVSYSPRLPRVLPDAVLRPPPRHEVADFASGEHLWRPARGGLAQVEHFFRHELGWLCALLTRSLGVRRCSSNACLLARFLWPSAVSGVTL